MSTVLLTGGTGLVGKKLITFLLSKNYQVNVLSRNPKENDKYSTFNWDIENKFIDEKAFENVKHIIHLAGANISNRWTKAYKQELWDSRVKSTQLLEQYVQKLNIKLDSFLGASAIGFYGNSGYIICTETTPKGIGFMANLCEAWENSSTAFENLSLKRIILRIGLVLSNEGGVLEKMTPTAKFGVGSYFGNGKQTYSWIHIDDLCRMILFGLENDNVKGVYNAVASQTLSNKEFSKALNKAMGKIFIPASTPKIALKIILGEMSEMLFHSNNVSNKKILDTGFTFKYPLLKDALNNLV